MSLNKYMHPRNIYRTPPNFKQLAIDYPEFRKHVKQDLTGKVTVNFKDVHTLRALTCTLLKKDFGLEVEIPLAKMIPTVPLRLNYILWIEDLLSISGESSSVTGLDVGTGASCVYPLLAAKSNGWKMLASEVDADSAATASQNVQRNALGGLIAVKKVSGDTLLKEAIEGETEPLDFCMCNPPFFASPQELNPAFKARCPDRPRPRNAFSATMNEVVADGGEVNFIKRMIDESKEIRRKIRIYTSMVGHKSSLPPLKKLLRDADVVSFKQTEFCQGHTTRWALAWTYHDIDLRKVPEQTVLVARKSKPKAPLVHVVPLESIDGDATESYKILRAKLLEALNALQMDVRLVKESKNVTGYCATAYRNTWSHQRRKKRERKRLGVALETSVNDEDVSEKISQMKVHSPKSPLKRDLDDEDGYYSAKRAKPNDGPDEYYLKNSIVVRRDNASVTIEVMFVEGSAGREGTHQIMQYIKNNLNFDKE